MVLARAGQLQTRVRIEREVRGADDGFGNQVLTWSPLATVWARVWPARGRETVLQGRLQSRGLVEVIIRYTAALGIGDSALNESDRVVVVESGQVLNVRWVGDEDHGKQWITIIAESGEPT